MRTVTGIVILIGAAVAGAFLIPMLSRKSSGGAGSLDKAASDVGGAVENLADSTLDASAVPVGYAAELIDEASEVPLWTWLVPIGGPLAYAVGQEIYEEFPDYTGVEED